MKKESDLAENKVLKRIFNFLFNSLTLGFYIRSIFETSQFILFWSTYEIKKWNTSVNMRIVLLALAILFMILMILFTIFNGYQVFYSYTLDKTKHNKLGEFFKELKSQNKAKLFNIFLFTRRLLLAIIFVTWESVSSRFLVGVLRDLKRKYKLNI